MNEKIERLVEGAERWPNRASKGPWARWKGHATVFQGPPQENEPWAYKGIKNGVQVAECDDDFISKGQAKRNAAFIARARTDVPKLCAEVRRLDAEFEAFKRDVVAYLRAQSTANSEFAGHALASKDEAYAKVVATTGDPYPIDRKEGEEGRRRVRRERAAEGILRPSSPESIRTASRASGSGRSGSGTSP